MELTCSAVMFDSDGVLVDSHLDGYRAWMQLASEFDFELTDEIFATLTGVRTVDSLARFVPADQVQNAVARLEDIEVSLAASTQALPGAVEVLTSLGGARWAIVTSASRRLGTARWRGAGIPIPPVVIAAEDVERGKPAPDPYVAGAQALGIDAADCIVFEDSAAGAAAGEAAGASVVAVGDLPWPSTPAARVADLGSIRMSHLADGRLSVGVSPRQ